MKAKWKIKNKKRNGSIPNGPCEGKDYEADRREKESENESEN